MQLSFLLGGTLNNKLEEAIVNGFKKYDAGKLDWSLMPEEALEQVAKVLMFGKKYGAWNWLDNASQVEYSRYLNAIERHLKAYKRGANRDAESNLHHLAHVITNCLFLITYDSKEIGIDNRKKDLL